MNGEQHQNTGELRPQYQTYDRQKCFVAYSEQAYWSIDLLEAASEVLSEPEFNLEPDYARKHYISDVPLRQKASELIANARYGIYDLSWWRRDDESPWQIPRNVFIELGIGIALNRPTLLLRHESNKEAGLELPNCLQCLSDQILEFSGKHSLKKVLLKHLPTWINKAPEKAWWNRHCIFGNRACEYREAHPRTEQFGQNTLNCSVADGADGSCSDFRHIVEEVLHRFNNIDYTYLDNLSLEKDYNFILCTHCQKIRSSPFAIYRITSRTQPEVFIAIGISLALEAQFGYKIFRILITEDIQIVPSLLSGYEVVIAKSDKAKKDNLRKIMPDVIKKVRETKWKPIALPFTEISVILSEKIQLDTKDSLVPNSGVPDTITLNSNITKLSNSQLNKLWEAMVDAFPNTNQLEVILNDAFDVRLKEITRLRNIVKAVLSVISWAESKGTLEQLIKSAYKFNYSNIKLQTITKELYPQLLEHTSKTPQLLKQKENSISVNITSEDKFLSNSQQSNPPQEIDISDIPKLHIARKASTIPLLPQYQDYSVPNAILILMRHDPTAHFHVDAIVLYLYGDGLDEEQFIIAKATVSKMLSTGTQARLWYRVLHSQGIYTLTYKKGVTTEPPKSR